MADTLKSRINDAMKEAMRARNKERLATIRLILAALKQREVDERITLDDTAVLAVLDKMMKQRRDSVSQYRAADRNDLADREEAEIAVIAEYMPQPLSESELTGLIDSAVNESGASSMAQMGAVMALLRPQVQGRADMGAVSAAVKARLNA